MVLHLRKQPPEGSPLKASLRRLTGGRLLLIRKLHGLPQTWEG